MSNINEIQVSLYGNIEKYNDVLSKARCRIFYKYGNRNGTYITDDFAEKLIASLPYAPVKGIYEDTDYSDHGSARNEGRIYGIVPENPNIQWENHLDEDGMERTYACADVLIFTAIYPEANEIVGKSQSMELFEPSLKYHFEYIQGQKYVVFDEGCFLGLQVLGDAVEPCFEGAAFYTLQENIESAIRRIKEYSLKGEENQMPQINFKLSDSQKRQMLWNLLNPNYNEEGNWTVENEICEIYDNYALVYEVESNTYKRCKYNKNDENDSLTLGEVETVYIMDITENEKNTIETLRKLNGDTYELVSENLVNADKNAEENSNFSIKIEELNETIATLNTEAENAKNEYETNYSALKAEKEQLDNEVNELRTFKYNIEHQQKEAVIMEYNDKLSDEIIEEYKEKIDEYTALELDKELTYKLKESNPSAFSLTHKDFLPKDIPLTGIEEILSKYNK